MIVKKINGPGKVRASAKRTSISSVPSSSLGKKKGATSSAASESGEKSKASKKPKEVLSPSKSKATAAASGTSNDIKKSRITDVTQKKRKVVVVDAAVVQKKTNIRQSKSKTALKSLKKTVLGLKSGLKAATVTSAAATRATKQPTPKAAETTKAAPITAKAVKSPATVLHPVSTPRSPANSKVTRAAEKEEKRPSKSLDRASRSRSGSASPKRGKGWPTTLKTSATVAAASSKNTIKRSSSADKGKQPVQQPPPAPRKSDPDAKQVLAARVTRRQSLNQPPIKSELRDIDVQAANNKRVSSQVSSSGTTPSFSATEMGTSKDGKSASSLRTPREKSPAITYRTRHNSSRSSRAEPEVSVPSVTVSVATTSNSSSNKKADGKKSKTPSTPSSSPKDVKKKANKVEKEQTKREPNDKLLDSVRKTGKLIPKKKKQELLRKVAKSTSAKDSKKTKDISTLAAKTRKPRVASLNAMCKIMLDYEGEQQQQQQEMSAKQSTSPEKSEKSEKTEAKPSSATKTKGSTPSSYKSVGKTPEKKVPPPKKKASESPAKKTTKATKKMPDAKKKTGKSNDNDNNLQLVPLTRKRKELDDDVEIIDTRSCKRVASLNASAIMSACFSMEPSRVASPMVSRRFRHKSGDSSRSGSEVQVIQETRVSARMEISQPNNRTVTVCQSNQVVVSSEEKHETIEMVKQIRSVSGVSSKIRDRLLAIELMEKDELTSPRGSEHMKKSSSSGSGSNRKRKLAKGVVEPSSTQVTGVTTTKVQVTKVHINTTQGPSSKRAESGSGSSGPASRHHSKKSEHKIQTILEKDFVQKYQFQTNSTRQSYCLQVQTSAVTGGGDRTTVSASALPPSLAASFARNTPPLQSHTQSLMSLGPGTSVLPMQHYQIHSQQPQLLYGYNVAPQHQDQHHQTTASLVLPLNYQTAHQHLQQQTAYRPQVSHAGQLSVVNVGAYSSHQHPFGSSNGAFAVPHNFATGQLATPTPSVAAFSHQNGGGHLYGNYHPSAAPSGVGVALFNPAAYYQPAGPLIQPVENCLVHKPVPFHPNTVYQSQGTVPQAKNLSEASAAAGSASSSSFQHPALATSSPFIFHQHQKPNHVAVHPQAVFHPSMVAAATASPFARATMPVMNQQQQHQAAQQLHQQQQMLSSAMCMQQHPAFSSSSTAIQLPTPLVQQSTIAAAPVAATVSDSSSGARLGVAAPAVTCISKSIQCSVGEEPLRPPRQANSSAINLQARSNRLEQSNSGKNSSNSGGNGVRAATIAYQQALAAASAVQQQQKTPPSQSHATKPLTVATVRPQLSKKVHSREVSGSKQQQQRDASNKRRSNFSSLMPTVISSGGGELNSKRTGPISPVVVNSHRIASKTIEMPVAAPMKKTFQAVEPCAVSHMPSHIPIVPVPHHGSSATALKKPTKRRFAHGWSWTSSKTTKKPVYISADGPAIVKSCYQSMKHIEGDVIRIGDCVLLRSGPRKTDLPFVAKICALWESDEGEMMMSLLWYYRPEHTDMGRKPNQMVEEIFASKHRDVNSVATIEDKCYVLTYNEYCRFRKKQKMSACLVKKAITQVIVPEPSDPYPRRSRFPPLTTSPEMIFCCRKVYDFRQKRTLKNPL